jgi:hypothetical protein
MDISDVIYEHVPPGVKGNKLGGFEVKSKKTGSWFMPMMAHPKDGFFFYAYSIFLPHSQKTISGSFCEDRFRAPRTIPPDFPPELVARYYKLSEEQRNFRMFLIEDFIVDTGSRLENLGEIDREAVVQEMLFFYNATIVASREHAYELYIALNSYSNKQEWMKRSKRPATPTLIDFFPQRISELRATFINNEDAFYVRHL